jgi:hypothetical protein
MTKQEFKTNFKFSYFHQVVGNTTFVAITKVIRRRDGVVVDSVKTTFDIFETTNWLSDSQAASSLISWDWNKLIDETKRRHMDYFALRGPIVDFSPLNHNTDIAPYYM